MLLLQPPYRLAREVTTPGPNVEKAPTRKSTATDATDFLKALLLPHPNILTGAVKMHPNWCSRDACYATKNPHPGLSTVHIQGYPATARHLLPVGKSSRVAQGAANAAATAAANAAASA